MTNGLIIATIVLLASCSGGKNEGKKANNKQNSSYPVTIENVTKSEGTAVGENVWQKKEQTFDEAPKKVVANTRPAAELLLHLGLKDRIAGVGAVFGQEDPTVAKEFDTLNHLSDQYISKEVALSVDPDLIYGRGGLFDNAEWGVGTVDSLNEMGIPTYVLESSTNTGTFDDIYQDIDNLGKIFNVEDQATTFKQELKDRQKALADKLKAIKEEKTFAYLHTDDPENLYVYSLTDDSFSLSVFDMVKLENAFPDLTGEVPLETMIAADPDVLIVPIFDGFGGKDSKAAKLVEALYKNPKLSSLKAIKNKEVYILDYNYMFGYGYQSLDGVEQLAKEMYPDLFK